jgi:hypothetical protein
MLLGAAPALCELDADIDCTAPPELQQTYAALRNEPPFERLRVRTLSVKLYNADDEGAVVEASAADVLQLMSAIAVHAPLLGLRLEGWENNDEAPMSAPAVLDAVISTVLSRQLSSLWLRDCFISPASAPALARLLSGDALSELAVQNSESVQLFDADAAVPVARALRANATLTSLKLNDVDFWANEAAVEALLDALRGHVSLRVLDLSSNQMQTTACEHAGCALAKLVAINSRVLHSLSFAYSFADEACLNPVFQALPYNAHLRTLGCRNYNHGPLLSNEFAGAVVLPTVRANAGLKVLAVAVDNTPAGSALRAAEALVAARRL